MFRRSLRAPRLTAQLQEPKTHYLPVSQIGEGGMAEVWKGQATVETGETYPVAIKRVRPELAHDPLYRSMFEDEARLGMLLRHPNIVRVYDAREVGNTFIMIMEYVNGPSLDALLGPAQKRAQAMPVQLVAYIGLEIAKALEYAHSAKDFKGKHLGIIHRDVSPHNVLVGHEGLVKLLDFGLANASVHKTEHAPSTAGGKLGYLAPEVIEDKLIDGRVDVFSLGVMMWEALSGQRLFLGESDQETVHNILHKEIIPPSYLNGSVPAQLDRIIARMLARNPQHRFASTRELAKELQACVQKHYRDVGPSNMALMASMYEVRNAHQAEQVPTDVLRRITRELEDFAVEASRDTAPDFKG